MIDVPIQVKDALRDGRLRKNYRFNVLNDDGTTDFVIDNNTLVSESVSIDERMCSGDTIKFGLCEGSSLEFQYFNHENITDRQIQAFIDIEYGEDLPYSIPMGFFTVKNCSRQASTGIIKATCYNKLQSAYLDQKANLLLQETYTTDNALTMFDIRYALLSDFKIIEERKGVTPSTPSQILLEKEISLGNFTLNKLFGVESPINAYRLSATSTSTNFELFNSSFVFKYIQNSTNAMFDAYYGTLTGLERNIVSFMKDLINKADLSVTWDDVLDYICTHDGFQNIIGVDRQYTQSGTLVTDHYSTIQWEYEEAHGLAHTVKGKIIDVQKLGFIGIFDVLIPNELYVNSLVSIVPYDGTLGNSGSTEYQYYINDSLTDTATAIFPFAVFSDLTRYQTGFTGGYRAILPFEYANISDADLLTATPSTIPDFTLRELQTAVFETQAQFGQLDRVTDLFSGVELNHSRLLPQETLYPDNALYPDGAAASATKSMYSKLWADEGNIHKWRYLIITYKGLDANNSEADFTLQRTINADGTDDYNCSDNWLFRNLIWTEQDIGDYADAMVSKMQAITWFPFEMWCAGLPYLETGDEIEIPLGENSYTSYVLQRQLKGIQNLQDTYINGTLDIF